MLLPALGVNLNRIRHVFAQQAAKGVLLQVAEAGGCLTPLKDAPKAVEGRSVPERFVAGLSCEAVGSP